MEEEAKRAYILGRLKRDRLAVDFQWSLLVAALSSYRHDTALRPFPPGYLRDGGPGEGEGADAAALESRNYRALEKAVDRLTNVGDFHESDNSKLKTDKELTDLMYWLLNRPSATGPFQLKLCDKEKFTEIQSLTGQCASVPISAPNYIFEVEYSAAATDKFESVRAGRDLMYAYHGSRLENFHSILHYGLQGHLSKNALFGEGTYLSAELSVCLNYAPTGQAWDKSHLGHKLSCVAVCEIIDDPSVKCQVKVSGNGGRSRASVSGSLGGEVPEKYYVVRNNDMMRLKYLLVYAEKSQPRASLRQSAVAWLLHHKYSVMIAVYVLLLLAVGLYNSKYFRSQVRRYLRGR